MSMTNPFRALCAELLADYDNCHYRSELSDRARAALAQLDPESTAIQLAARPLLEKVARMGDRIGQHTVGEVMAISDQAAAWLEANPPGQPVPVSERLPGPEDCDAEGGCWWWHPDHKEDDFDDGWILLNPKWASGRRDSDDSLIYTHWLPHWALPVPTPANTINQEDY
jgi:hypothetical protein